MDLLQADKVGGRAFQDFSEGKYFVCSFGCLCMPSLQGTLSVGWDPTSADGSKVVVTGIPAGVAWQELKDHFDASVFFRMGTVVGLFTKNSWTCNVLGCCSYSVFFAFFCCRGYMVKSRTAEVRLIERTTC